MLSKIIYRGILYIIMSQTWTLVNNNNLSRVNYVGCYRNGQTTVTNGQAVIIMDSSANSRIYYSSNGGTTISSSTTIPRALSEPSFPISTYLDSTHKIVYIADVSNNVNVSYDGGITFTFHSNVTSTNNGVVTYVTCDVNGSNICALVYNPGNMSNSLYIYSGSSWSQSYTTGSIGGRINGLISSSNGQYVYMLISLLSPRTLLYSTNYGNTINSYTLPNDSHYKIACNSSGSIIYSIADLNIYKSTNYGSSWNIIGSNMLVSPTYIATDSTGTNVIVSNTNNIYYTNNGGTTWSSYNINGQCPVTISSDGLTMYAFVNGTGLYQFQYPPPPPPIICFHESTKILTNLGYQSIRDLLKGDLIQTVDHGYVPIELIGHREIYHPANTYDRIKDQLYLCSKSKYPALFEDLIITGCHSILVKQFDSPEQRDKTERLLGDIYVTDEHYRLPACLDDRADVYDKPGKYTIYHFALENADYYMNYGVYANGLLVESSSRRFMHEIANMNLIE
jgi:hypothetical protein